MGKRSYENIYPITIGRKIDLKTDCSDYKLQREMLKTLFSEEMLRHSRIKTTFIMIFYFVMALADFGFIVLTVFFSFKYYNMLKDIQNCSKFDSFNKEKIICAFLVIVILAMSVVALSVLLYRLCKKENHAEAITFFSELR